MDEAVFERDAYTCVRCGEAADGANGREDLSVFPLAAGENEPDSREDGPNPRETLVTVCGPCRNRLEANPPTWLVRWSGEPAGSLLQALREVTSSQGAAVAAVADFAAVATGGAGGDDPDDRSNYLAGRREARIAVAFTDRSLRAAAELDPEDADDDSAVVGDAVDALSDVLALAESLQLTLREVLELAETAVAAADRCPVCLAPIEATERCDECGSPRPETAQWEDDEGTVAFGSLYGAVNDRLKRASETTARLTEETSELAESLVERR